MRQSSQPMTPREKDLSDPLALCQAALATTQSALAQCEVALAQSQAAHASVLLALTESQRDNLHHHRKLPAARDQSVCLPAGRADAAAEHDKQTDPGSDAGSVGESATPEESGGGDGGGSGGSGGSGGARRMLNVKDLRPESDKAIPSALSTGAPRDAYEQSARSVDGEV